MSLAEIGRELRAARREHDLSQLVVGRAAGVSQTRVSRFERGVTDPGIDAIARLAAVVGLDLSVRVFPAGTPLRDAGHIALLLALRAAASPAIRWSSEVPLAIPGDRRAWDAVGRLPGGGPELHVEAETRLRDVQSLLRRVMLKKRDAGADRVVLVVKGSRTNRGLAHAASDLLHEALPVHGRAALAALRDARDPGGDAFLLL